MKALKSRNHTKIIASLLAVVVVFLLLDVNSTTKMAINFQTREYNIPVYLKVLNFYDRHFNYKYLAEKITMGTKSRHDRVLSLAAWVNNNIKRIPEGVDIVDSHPWTIVQRRLGEPDQFSDILSVLLIYSGVESFFREIDTQTVLPLYKRGRHPLTFFRIKDTWSVADPYQGVYFVNEKGNFASLSDLREGRWKMANFENKLVRDESLFQFYSKLLSLLPSSSEINRTNIYERGGRANIQNPTGRFLYEIHKRFHGFPGLDAG